MIVERGYLDHWKTNTLRQLTGLPNASELPLRLWEHCESRMDDFIEGKDGLVIAGICRWQGEAKALITALERCRWIEKADGGYVIRGWRDRQRGAFASRLNGSKGGRPKKKPDSKPNEPGRNLQVSDSYKQVSESKPIANPQGGERRGEELSGEPPPPRASARASSGEIEATWTLIFSVLGQKKRRAGYDAEHAISRVAENLPLSDEDAGLLRWFYALPHDPKNIDLRGRFNDADKLAINLFPSIERARAYAKKTGRVQASAPQPPEGWQEWFSQTHSGMPVPATFAELPDYLQDDARRALSKIP